MQNFGTLFYYELKKIMKSRLVIALIVVMVGFSVLQGINQAGQDSNGNTEMRELRKTNDGRPVNDVLLSEMVEAADEYGVWWNETNAAYEGLSQWVREVVDYGTPLADHTAEDIYRKREETILEAYESARISEGERAYWAGQEAQVDKPIIWYEDGEAAGLIDCVIGTAQLMLFVATLGLAGVFAGERRDRTDDLIRCTPNGYRETYLAKLAAGLCFALVSLVAMDAIALSMSVLFWGTNGWNAAIQLLLPFAAMPMTLGDMFFVMLGISFTVAILYASMTLFFSELLKNPLAVMGAVLGLVLTVLIEARNIPFSHRLLGQVLYLLSPFDMVSLRVVYEFRLIGAAGHYLTAWQFAPILYLAISAALLAIGGRMYMRRER